MASFSFRSEMCDWLVRPVVAPRRLMNRKVDAVWFPVSLSLA